MSSPTKEIVDRALDEAVIDPGISAPVMAVKLLLYYPQLQGRVTNEAIAELVPLVEDWIKRNDYK